MVAGKFALGPLQIRDAARYAFALTTTRPPDQSAITADDLHHAARARSNQSLRELGQKIESQYNWEDLVLPRRSQEALREIFFSVKHHHTVYETWGFDSKLAMNKGVNALFYGPSGTGKTMAAQVLTNELKLDLYRIDLATVVSKYIGETEKNLSRVFAAAQASNAILFFDEADALFGKRSGVKDAHDRYANIEVAYLLQKMEDYDGIAILATNLRSNIDEAFARRLHHTVEFPFPDANLRERIWRSVFPAQTPLSDTVDFGFLANQFELSGGNIRNVALAAAFLAADASQPVNMPMLVVGVARELQKIDRMPTRAAFREYYAFIQESQ
jgi:SpoVK/Ycf46/Vps4 family AAA+-type ATPase